MTRLTVGLVALVLVLLIGGIGAVLALDHRGGTVRLFEINDRGNTDVYVEDDEHGLRLNLTRHPSFNGQPQPSPDGRWILFISGRDRNTEIYVMNRHGGDVRNLTRHTARDYAPEWIEAVDGALWVRFDSTRGGTRETYVMRLTDTVALREEDAALAIEPSERFCRSGDPGAWSTCGRYFREDD